MNNILLFMIFIMQIWIFKERMLDFMVMKSMRCELTDLKETVSVVQQELKTLKLLFANAAATEAARTSGRQALMKPTVDSLNDYFMDVNNSLDEYFKPPLCPDVEPIFSEVATQSPTVK